jgi:hypothetical protein
MARENPTELSDEDILVRAIEISRKLKGNPKFSLQQITEVVRKRYSYIGKRRNCAYTNPTLTPTFIRALRDWVALPTMVISSLLHMRRTEYWTIFERETPYQGNPHRSHKPIELRRAAIEAMAICREKGMDPRKFVLELAGRPDPLTAMKWLFFMASSPQETEELSVWKAENMKW